MLVCIFGVLVNKDDDQNGRDRASKTNSSSYQLVDVVLEDEVHNMVVLEVPACLLFSMQLNKSNQIDAT